MRKFYIVGGTNEALQTKAHGRHERKGSPRLQNHVENSHDLRLTPGGMRLLGVRGSACGLIGPISSHNDC